MGLDMFAYTTSENIPASTDFAVKDASEIHYWRKHPDLHGWMHELYRSKGGANPEFNLSTVQLTEGDLLELERTIRAGGLPDNNGFFFGESDGREAEDDLDFVAEAREAIAAGFTVFYKAWW